MRRWPSRREVAKLIRAIKASQPWAEELYLHGGCALFVDILGAVYHVAPYVDSDWHVYAVIDHGDGRCNAYDIRGNRPGGMADLRPLPYAKFQRMKRQGNTHILNGYELRRTGNLQPVASAPTTPAPPKPRR